MIVGPDTRGLRRVPLTALDLEALRAIRRLVERREISIAALGRELGVSQSTARSRRERLLNMGWIQSGWTISAEVEALL